MEQKNNITLDYILKEWREDSAISIIHMDEESIKIPALHAKYLQFYSEIKSQIVKLKTTRKKLIKHLTSYYKGEYNENVEMLSLLKKQPLRKKVLKGDIWFNVEHDKNVIKLDDDINEKEVLLSALGEILKSISTRNFVIKNAIEWQKLVGGDVI